MLEVVWFFIKCFAFAALLAFVLAVAVRAEGLTPEELQMLLYLQALQQQQQTQRPEAPLAIAPWMLQYPRTYEQPIPAPIVRCYQQGFYTICQ